MTNVQLYAAIGIPLIFNTALVLLAWQALSTKMDDRFAAINQRLDDLRDLWRAELRRVEEVLDARLQHLEARHDAR